ncbi:MAG TPA: glycosyltransferase family 2 protein [Bryobacteraceae bacterium]|jgi:GT2 family glycosyltransferase|nr:glycosyltransferase family 2 protein [Bryobacteraceae bacterium]
MRGDQVTIIVPVWNRRELLCRLLDGLDAQTWRPAEVLVIDNGSGDGAPELAEQRGARVVRMGSNTGFSRAVNRGIQECRTPWLALVNNDVEPAPDWLEQLCLAAAQHPDAWFFTGKILNAAERRRIDGTFDLVARSACAWRAGFGASEDAIFSTPRLVRSAPGTAALFRTDLFTRIGLLEESFESYLEDVDFGIRCACQGYAGWYVPAARAWHQGSGTLGRWHADVVRRTARNQVFLVARHYPASLLARYFWSILVGQGLWGLVAFRHGCGWAFLRGKIAGLRLFRRVRKQSLLPDAPKLAAFLEEGERELRNIQQQTGFNSYWRVYFWLTRGGTT